MNIDQLKNKIPDYAKDIRLNLATILTETGSPDLSQKQILLITLGVAFALKNHVIVKTVLSDTDTSLSENDIQAARSAAAIMAMNNIYYRFTHLVSDKSFLTMPARLRMNIIGNPGIAKTDFELMCLAISAINGCGMCMDAHTNALIKAGMTKLGIQSVIRITSVLNAVSVSFDIQPEFSDAALV